MPKNLHILLLFLFREATAKLKGDMYEILLELSLEYPWPALWLFKNFVF